MKRDYGVVITDHEVSNSDHFWCLKSIIHEEVEIEDGAIDTIKAHCMK